jgi:ribonuclease P protein subunit RPR2
MGKSKSEKKGEGVPHRHIHSRISYLHQAATYLSTISKASSESEKVHGGALSKQTPVSTTPQRRNGNDGLSQQLLSHAKGISRKTNIRMSKDLKRTICKRCQALLVADLSSTQMVRNASKDQAKPWADVLEVRCNACGTVKRYPVTSGQRKHSVNFTRKESSGPTEETET